MHFWGVWYVREYAWARHKCVEIRSVLLTQRINECLGVTLQRVILCCCKGFLANRRCYKVHALANLLCCYYRFIARCHFFGKLTQIDVCDNLANCVLRCVAQPITIDDAIHNPLGIRYLKCVMQNTRVLVVRRLRDRTRRSDGKCQKYPTYLCLDRHGTLSK